jgi:hypothetical protein
MPPRAQKLWRRLLDDNTNGLINRKVMHAPMWFIKQAKHKDASHYVSGY